MAENLGKKFEHEIQEAFEKVPGLSIDRLHDQMSGYLGSRNVSDFIVYKKPYEYYIECKSVHGNTLPFSNITENQWNGMLEKSKIEGVFAGVICWWIDKDKTFFLPIKNLRVQKEEFQKKSIGLDYVLEGSGTNWIEIKGKKKRVFFDYDMQDFIERMEENA